ncbi:hypothetical protein [Mesorhizobium sp. Root157]|uniref:hypothetical protein n=1 Tax=Mesorhizobium sp. Root157 TaxID=1736477 RepID=UPI0012E3B3FE|nr:hypothetical protein [Mesorhizobium sp. Root157]
MTNNSRSPVRARQRHRANTIKTVGMDFDELKPTGETLALQVAIVARRYRLSPRIARLVCHLAQIGEVQ